MKTPCHTRSAFSIIELLISLIIISILTSTVILIAGQRAEEARLESARSDMRQIISAQQAASTDTGYYLRLYCLDDITGGNDGFNPGVPGDFDYFQDEVNNTRNPDGDLFGIRPDFGSMTSGSVVANPGDLVDITHIAANETRYGILLPYISYPRQWEDAFTSVNYNVPSDPWGMPYVLMTRQGFINDVDSLFSPNQGMISTTVSVIGTGVAVNAVVFDRFTVVSFGPNALPGDGAGSDIGTDDDIFFQLN